MAHTGENIGKWLIYSHRRVECEPSFIGSHVVDGAGNVGKLIEVLWFRTIEDRSGIILSAKFDSDHINMTRNKATGTSLYKINIRSELEKYLTLLHTYLVRLGGFGMRMKLCEFLRRERHQMSSPIFTTDVITIWESDHIEASRAS